jgi:hypothetical protein
MMNGIFVFCFVMWVKGRYAMIHVYSRHWKGHLSTVAQHLLKNEVRKISGVIQFPNHFKFYSLSVLFTYKMREREREKEKEKEKDKEREENEK